MGTVAYVACPAGQWTHVSSPPAPFGLTSLWCRDASVQVGWRRYLDAPPFYTDGSATLAQGKNTWPVPPAVFNTWWFNPTSGTAFIRIT